MAILAVSTISTIAVAWGATVGNPPLGARTQAGTAAQAQLEESEQAPAEAAAMSLSLDFLVRGRLVEVLVKRGDVVTKGQLLARIDPSEAQGELRRALVSLEGARARASQLLEGLSPAEVAEASIRVGQAEASVGSASQSMSNLEILSDARSASLKDDIEQTRRKLEQEAAIAEQNSEVRKEAVDQARRRLQLDQEVADADEESSRLKADAQGQADRAVADRAAADRVAANRAAADRAAAADRVAADRVAADRVAAADRAVAADQAAADRVTADRAAADRVTADRAAADRATADRAAADRAAADRAAADRAAADRVTADRAAADRAAADRAAAGRAAADRAAADRAAAENQKRVNERRGDVATGEVEQSRLARDLARLQDRQRVDDAKAALADALNSRVETAVQQRSEMELAQNRLKSALISKELVEATNAVDAEGPGAGDLAAAKATIKMAEADVALARIRLHDTELRSPAPGTVAAINGQVGEIPNQSKTPDPLSGRGAFGREEESGFIVLWVRG